MSTSLTEILAQPESPNNKKWPRIRAIIDENRDLLDQSLDSCLSEISMFTEQVNVHYNSPLTICFNTFTKQDFLYSPDHGPSLRLRPGNVYHGYRIYDLANFLTHHCLDPEQSIFALNTYECFAPLTFSEYELLPLLIRFPLDLLTMIINSYHDENIQRDDIRREFAELQAKITLADVITSKQRSIKPEPSLAEEMDRAYSQTIWRPSTLPASCNYLEAPLDARVATQVKPMEVDTQKRPTDWLLLVYHRS